MLRRAVLVGFAPYAVGSYVPVSSSIAARHRGVFYYQEGSVDEPMREKDECEHPAAMIGPWAKYEAGTSWIIGWACGACGHSQETGTSPGKPHWAKEMKP